MKHIHNEPTIHKEPNLALQLQKRILPAGSPDMPTPQQCSRTLSAVGDAMYVIGGKWKLKIIIALKEGNKRFNDLQRAVTGISARVLSTELKDLELNGLVMRRVYPYTPVTVEYLATEYTESLQPLLTAMAEWGSRHREKIMADSKIRKESTTS